MSIQLSEKHGVNPAIPKCFFCGEDKNEIILAGRLPNDADAREVLHGKVVGMEPCDKCKDYMRQGVILVSVRKDSDENNPYRTGGWVVIKEEAAARLFSDVFGQEIGNKRFAFLEDEVWDTIGLPRNENHDK